jgi:hypothetical protein
MGNFLFENRGDGTFEEVGLLAGVAYAGDGEAQGGMGVDAADYDRDGFIDFFVCNFSHDYCTLYRNQGNGFFEDVSYESGLGWASWAYVGYGEGFFDFDNDEWEDLFVATGHVYPQVDSKEIGTQWAGRKLFFRNLGNGKFEEIAGPPEMGLADKWVSRSIAFSDFDNDGDIDAAVSNMDQSPSLYRNEGGNRAGHWLVLGLEGTASNRSAIGSRVTVETESGKQLREVRGGASYQATNDFRVHFGLGVNETVDRLSVKWPNGKVEAFQKVKANRHYQLKEGSGQLTPVKHGKAKP